LLLGEELTAKTNIPAGPKPEEVEASIASRLSGASHKTPAAEHVEDGSQIVMQALELDATNSPAMDGLCL
jgi:hypothetical protein